MFKSAPEAYAHFTDEKNVKLFSKFGVMTETEMNSRRSIFFENYRKIVGIEARTMVEMTVRDILPAASKYGTALSEPVTARRAVIAGAPAAMEEEVIGKLSALMSEAYDAANVLAAAEKTACSKATEEDSANAYLTAVIPKMAELRSKVDAMEVLTSREYWPMPTYGDLTFRV